MIEGKRTRRNNDDVEADRGSCVVCACVWWWFSVCDASRAERKIGFAGSGVPRYLSQSTPHFGFFPSLLVLAVPLLRQSQRPFLVHLNFFFQVIFFFSAGATASPAPRLPSLTLRYLLLARQPAGADDRPEGQMWRSSGCCMRASSQSASHYQVFLRGQRLCVCLQVGRGLGNLCFFSCFFSIMSLA